MRTRKRKKRRTGLYLVMLVVGIFLSTLVVQGYNLKVNCKRLAAEQTQLEAKKKSLQKEQQDIKDKSAYMKTDKYIEEVAREKFGLVYENEIIFKPTDSD